MKVFTNNVPTNCNYLTNGKHYEFEPELPECKYGHIIDDDGDRIYVITEKSVLMCSHLNDRASWEFVNE